MGLVDRADRVCPRCPGRVEDAAHMMLECPAYAEHRQQFPSLFGGEPTLRAFRSQQPACELAAVAGAIRAAHRVNSDSGGHNSGAPPLGGGGALANGSAAARAQSQAAVAAP